MPTYHIGHIKQSLSFHPNPIDLLSSQEQSHALSPGGIIGGVLIGVSVAIVFTVMAAVFVRRRKKVAVNVSLIPQPDMPNPRYGEIVLTGIQRTELTDNSYESSFMNNAAYLTNTNTIPLSRNVAYNTIASPNEACRTLQPFDESLQDHNHTYDYIDKSNDYEYVDRF